ncbi:hypothetical protein ACFPMF_05935 [Larkinella bovis]|uniref:Neutral/alkaline non-lysosomal ceramidase N-terminal domain-containing protein n=1 Tax=Larkinella bovis TaxID=683041 RepID=A0ABW0I5P2_9BACT
MKKFFFALLSLVATVSVQAQPLRAGAAVRVITPEPLLLVSGGIGTPKKATEKKGDLFIRAFVLEKGPTRVAIVSVDNLGWPSVLGNKSRALIKSIPPENVLIGATHTHSGPDAYGFPDQSGKALADLPYLEKCVQQLAETVEEAVRKLQPATLKVAVGEAKGKIAFNYYADQLYDPRCGVIQALDATGKPIVTLVNYAIHPEVIGSDRGILSPDLCGPLYSKLESKTGGMAIFMNGAQGGMVTADVRREGGKEENTWEECIRIGELLGEEALRIVSTAPVLPNPSVYCAARSVEFPIESDLMKYIIRKSPLGYSISTTGSVTAQVNLLNIGPAQILTIPGEALPNIGYYVKRHMNTKFPFLFGLTNDAFGYMLTKVDFNSFKRYEYISRTSLGEMTGEIYIDQALRFVSESPKADQP